MQFEMMFSKIHRATVTDANLNYVGSITIDEELMEKAHLREYQKVDVLNITNGERFSTYVITGKAGGRDICINGAAAHKAKKGDKVIIVAYASLDEKELDRYKPYIVHVNENNDPIVG
ncbi:MAG: aspartate 1-decarboxylase [bacterium]